MELLKRANALAQKSPGYNYDSGIMRQVIEAGYDAIPEGAIICVSHTKSGQEKIKLENGKLVNYVNGNKYIELSIDTDRQKDNILIQYSVKMSAK